MSAKVQYIQTLLQSEYKGDCHSFVMLINFNKEQEFRDIPGSGLYFHDFSKQIDSYLVYHSPTAIQIVSRFQQIANIFVMFPHSTRYMVKIFIFQLAIRIKISPLCFKDK